MDGLETVKQHGSLRLVRHTDGDRAAVIEARDGKVYSLHAHDRREALDTPAGMLAVIGDDGWQPPQAANQRFDDLGRSGDDLAKEIW